MKTFASLGFAALLATAIAGCMGTSDLVDEGKAVASVEITPDNATLTKGASMQLHAIVQYADGTSKDVTEGTDTVWNTSNADIATVTEGGMVNAVDEGLVDISATYKGEKTDEHFAVTP